MKKFLLAAFVSIFLSMFTALAQGPTLLTHVDFEQGIPAGWTVSSTSNVGITTDIASTGTKALRMTPASSEVIITSPEFTITPGCATRLEFSHIPILENEKGGRVEVKKPNGTWQTLNLAGVQMPNCYDASYGSGYISFNGKFNKVMYWSGNTSVPLGDLDQSYWRNEIFYLFSTLGGTATSVQIRFIIPASTGAAANFTGWFLDDIRLYVANVPGDEVRVPQLKQLIQYPSLEMYPTCSDVPLRFDIRDAQGAMSVDADAVVVEYFNDDETTPNQLNLTKDPSNQNIYEGMIPFNGFGSETRWRLIIRDLKGNQLTYPFVHGHYNTYTAIRPHVGHEPLQTTGLSSQEMVFKTNARAALYQIRYSQEELIAAGYASGEIGGLSINLTQAAAGFSMPNFKLYIGNIDPDYQMDPRYQYSATTLTNVINEPIYINPPIGWHYMQFSEPFIWDGVSDILIKVCWGDATNVGGVTKVECISTSGENVTYKYEKTTDAPVDACTTQFPETGQTMNYKPNFKFDFVDNCNLPIDPGLSNTPSGLVAPGNCATTNTPLTVYLRNEGTNTLNEIVVNYSADDGTSGTATWTGNLASGDSVAFTVTSNMNITPGYRYLTIITSVNEPNIDWNQDNDTARYEFVVSAGPMNGIYSIGALTGVAADRQFSNFNEAFRMLECSGVSGPTTIKIALPESELKEELVFPQNINGASNTNKITFTSSTTTKKVLQPSNVSVANIDLSGCKYLVFENLEFRAADSYENNARIVTASLNTSDIVFKDCKFASRVNAETNQPDDITHLGSYPQRLTSVLNLSAASRIKVDDCLFSVPATTYIDIQGMSDLSMSDGIEIVNSVFEIVNMHTPANNTNITNNVINASLNKNMIVSNNKFVTMFPDDMGGISSNYYAIMLSSCKSFDINKNEFKLSGVSGIILSDIPSGTTSKIANNKIGIRNNHVFSYAPITLYGVNLVSGTNILLAYNNVYALGTDANAIGFNLGYTGTNITNIQSKNNIFVSELSGYAVKTTPTTPQSVAYSNNLYYKIPGENAPYLFYYGSSTVDSPTIWQTYTNETNSHYTENPLFVAWNDLSTTSTFLCGKGVAITQITDDFFGRPRANVPCIGALEFLPPTNNIYVMSVTPNNGTYNVMFDGTPSYSGCEFGTESVTVKFKNISDNTIPANSVTMNYKVGNSTVKTGTVTHAIQPNVEYDFNFTQTHDFSAPTQDLELELKAWSSFTLDTIKSNDTTIAKVFSSHQIPARADMSISVPYGTAATLNVQSNDSVYWFYTLNDTDPFLKSHSLQTDVLYADTTLYFSEKSEVPNIKITEVQLSKATTAEGLTNPLPAWVTVANAFEITNVGNGVANMAGYKMKYIKANANQDLGTTITKTYDFPADFVLAPGQTVTLLNKAQSSVDTDLALGIGTGTVSQTNKLGIFIENAQGVIIDAVALNGATFPASIGVPSSVWTGASTSLDCTGKAGISRISATGNDQTSWYVSSATNPMTIGTLNPTIVIAEDNGCYGYKTVYNVNVTGVPEVNPGVVDVSINGVETESACTLLDEEVKVKIVNMGVQASSDPIPVVCQVFENGTLISTITDSYTSSIAPYDTVEFVLGTTINLSATTAAREFELKAYTNLSTDVLHANDTSMSSITSLLTPPAPVAADQSIGYAEQTTLTATSQNLLIWYDDPYTETELTRGDYTTPILYTTDTFYVAAIIEQSTDKQVGTGTVLNTVAANPAPFAYTTKKAKEQYLYKASELSAVGVTEGRINSIAFNIDNVNANVTMGTYKVQIGTTSQNDITTWINGLEEVYSGSISLTTTDSGWETIQFAQPFQYDGQSNIVVQICFETTTTTGKVKVKQTETDFNSAISYRNANNNACEFTGTPTTVSQRRPNIQFNLSNFGCVSPREEVIVTVAAAPAVDAGLVSMQSPLAGTNILAGVATPVEVELKNFGSSAVTAATINWTVNGATQTPYNWTGSLASNATTIVNIGNYTFSSGAIEIVAWVAVEGDAETSNDTITTILSSCLGNTEGVTTVTIGPDATDDYATVNAFLDVLKTSGICGPIEAVLKQGTYNEQLVISGIAGLSTENYVIIRGEATAEQTIITYTPASTAEAEEKYVLSLDYVSGITLQNLTISATDTTATAIVKVSNSSNITFDQATFATPHSITPNIFNIKKSNSITFTDNNFYGSANQIETEDVITSLNIANNRFYDFGITALNLFQVNDLQINANVFSTDTSKIQLTAVKLSQISGSLNVMSNRVFLLKGTAERVGIELTNSTFTQSNAAKIANNAVSLVGPNVSTNLESFGISINNVTHLDLYYNTVYMKTSTNSAKSRALTIGADGANIRIRNNNLDNQGKGYTIHVAAPGTQVVLCNTNNYTVNGSKFANWGGDKATLALLQAANGMDNLSMSIENSFLNDSILSLRWPTDIVRAAEPLDDVNVDIENNVRPISPKPTIGAYEYIFTSTDTGIPSILQPVEGDEYIESEPLTVEVEIKNFGNYTISSVDVTAVLKYHQDSTSIIQQMTETWTGMLASLETTTFTFQGTFTPPLNYDNDEELYLYVYTTLPDDTTVTNDTAYTSFLTIPSTDLKIDGVIVTTERCNLTNYSVQTKIKNVGEYMVNTNNTVEVKYYFTERPNQIVTEQLTFPYVDQTNGVTFNNLQPGAGLTYTFNTTSDIYPTDGTDDTLHLVTIVKVVGDNKFDNDTLSSAKTVISKVSPPAPTVTDDFIPYGTWGHPSAEQVNNLPIKWYSNPYATAPFYAPTSYNSSKNYTTTQLFADTTFYVMVNASGAYPCASEFTPVTVHLDPRAEVDASVSAIVEPIPEGWVYMELGDTIKAMVWNYGTQPLSNFNISYSIKPTSPATAEEIIVTETCTATIQPDQVHIYSFNQLADMTNPAKTYKVRAWVDANNDYTALNDTCDYVLIKPKNGTNLYTLSQTPGGEESLDITRVKLGAMESTSNASGNKYTNYTEEIAPAVLFKGVGDVIEVQADNSSSMEAGTIVGGWAKVFLDWNRDGIFAETEAIMSDTIWSGQSIVSPVTVSYNTLSGLTRMRVILAQGGNETTITDGSSAPTRGEVEDYKVLIRTAEQINAELQSFVEPAQFLSETQQTVKVQLKNAGLDALTSATITWQLNSDPEQVYNWSGNLPIGATEIVTLGQVDLPLGNTTLKAFVSVAGDNYHENDTITKTVHVFRKVVVPYETNFDEPEGNDDFFAYDVNTSNPTNCWEFGTPAASNSKINAPYSEPNCWKTKLEGTYPANNESYLYTPIFDIGVVKPDTMTFMMRTSLATGTSMRIEYLNWEGKWVLLGGVDDPNANNWYNSEDGFTTTATWREVMYSLKSITHLFGNELQFRFVFKSATSRNDGIAIDDFEIKRAKRDQDAGIVSINLEPNDLPNYGSNFYPRVGVMNYGAQVLDNFEVCYMAEGMYIPICETMTNAGLEPEDTLHYTFTQGTYLAVGMPDPFNLCAFTRLNPTDIYTDNDSCCVSVVIGPLQKDVGIVAITSPGEQIVSNDNIEVAIHIKNYGLDPVSELPVGYTVSGGTTITETVYFTPPLYNGDEYIYRFNERFRASFGSVNLKCWTGQEGDYYHDNDTLYKRLEGTSATRDLEAKYVTIDDADPNNISVQLTFMNRSSVGIGNVTVGYYYNGDIANVIEETYRLGNIVPSGTLAHHKFDVELPRANGPYYSITAYVSAADENDRANDTTSVLYMGYRDGVADTIFVEQTAASDCKVQLIAHNAGTIGGTTQVRAHLVQNGDFANKITQTFTWEYDEPNPALVRYMNFDQRIPKNADGQYNLIAWIEYPYDADHRNDSTNIVVVKSYVGLEDEAAAPSFELEQNQPNPFDNQTSIGFTLPEAGNVDLVITNNLGQVVYQKAGAYPQGRSEIKLQDLNLAEGTYYYTMYYKDEKQVKKMIVVR